MALYGVAGLGGVARMHYDIPTALCITIKLRHFRYTGWAWQAFFDGRERDTFSHFYAHTVQQRPR